MFAFLARGFIGGVRRNLRAGCWGGGLEAKIWIEVGGNRS
jgi:hypothetical protein